MVGDSPVTDDFDTLDQPSEPVAAPAGFSIGFGNQCNEYVDVIQQALDLALGNTGNLAPDSAVVDALDELYTTARSAGATALLQLLVPLNQVLRSAEQAGFTLSQADTLLVQEAIIAITLGIDSIVNQKPTPGLLSDVTQRMIDVAAENKHEVRANSEATGLVNIFVSDADELLQRLFEQMQRWRASAFVGRGYDEVNRLLVSLHDSADSAGLSSIANVVRLLIDRIIAQRAADEVPDEEFFDLAIETIEVLGDDLDRIRNNEQLTDHTELYQKLSIEGTDPIASIAAYRAEMQANAEAQQAREARSGDVVLQPAGNAGKAGSLTNPGDSQFTQETAITDVQLLDNLSDSSWPDHRELVDVLREISRGTEAIRERIEQLRRTIHVYPDARQVTIESDSQLGSAVSAVDNIFFKIDSLISRQRKSVTSMASVLGVEEQQTVEALGAELIKHASVSALTVEYLQGSDNVVIDRQLYDHLGYAVTILLDSVLVPSLIKSAVAQESHGANDYRAEGRLVFDLAGDHVTLKIIGTQLHLSEFVVANASLRRVDEQMLKTQLPRSTTKDSAAAAVGRSDDGPGAVGRSTERVNIEEPDTEELDTEELDTEDLNTEELSTKELDTVRKDNDLVILAALQRLIDIAAFFQGRVTTSLSWNDSRTVSRGEIKMELPIAELSEELVLLRRGRRLYGVQSAAIDSIESITITDDTGDADAVLVRCRLGDGSRSAVRADSVVGKQSVSVTKNPWLMLGDAYSGAFVFSDSSLVLVLNTESLEADTELELSA